MSAMDVNSILQDRLAPCLAPQIEMQDGDVHLELRPALPPVLADSNQLFARFSAPLPDRLAPASHPDQSRRPSCPYTNTRVYFVTVDFTGNVPADCELIPAPARVHGTGSNGPTLFAPRLFQNPYPKHGRAAFLIQQSDEGFRGLPGSNCRSR